MPGVVVGGPIGWSLDRDEDGNRTYKLVHQVKVTAGDGPYHAMDASGLPATGSVWNFGDEVDLWAWCTAEMRVTPEGTDGREPHEYYRVEQKFSTKGKPGQRCQDTQVEDPLQEPPKIGGNFAQSQIEAVFDKDGTRIANVAREQIRGEQVKFYSSFPTVRVEINSLMLHMDLWAPMIQTVNDRALWGLPARFVRLDAVSWERKMYGTCCFYYTLAYDFVIDWSSKDADGSLIGWDRSVAEEGNYCLDGSWGKDGSVEGKWVLKNTAYTGCPALSGGEGGTNKAFYTRYRDKSGSYSTVILDENGLPASSADENIWWITEDGLHTGMCGQAANKLIQYYGESNFTLLGIPSSL